MAQSINRTTRRPNAKGMVKIMAGVSLSILVLLVCVMSVGCQTSNAVHRQGALDSGVASERMTYRPFQIPQQNPAYQLPQKASLADLLNPFKSRSNRIDNADTSVTNPQNLHHPAQNPSVTQVSAGVPDNAPSQTPLLRNDDPPEIIEFAAILGKTDQFSTEQKAEIIELLRRESPAMRGNMIANYMVAIRHSDLEGNSHIKGPASNPIMQASHVSSISDRDFSEPPIRLTSNNNIENELAMLESQALGHALYAPGNTQGMIRQVADEGARSSSTFRISRPGGEPGTIPQIDTNPILPTIAAPDDYATLRSQESLKPVTDVNTPGSMRDDQEIPSFRQPDFPETPVMRSREITLNQQADTRLAEIRLGNHNPEPNGTRIAIVETNSRIPQIMPSLTDAEEDGYDVTDVPQKLENTINTRFADTETTRLAVQTYPGNIDTTATLDLLATPQLRSMIPSYQQERWDETARRALNLLNTRIADSDTMEQKEQLHDEINQRLMSLTLGNQRDAIRTINGLPPELQEFWRNTMLGLSTMLDDVSFPNSSYRFDAAHSHLQTANLYLQNLCPVRIRKVSFINQCDGFGVYEAAPNEFRRGEPIFIYAEIDNLTCRESEGGYLTQVNSSYEITDVFDNKVASGEFSKTGKYTQSRIRDIFLLWRVDLPENIMPGKYFIKLSVVDTNHQNYPFDRQRLELNILPSLNDHDNRL